MRPYLYIYQRIAAATAAHGKTAWLAGEIPAPLPCMPTARMPSHLLAWPRTRQRAQLDPHIPAWQGEGLLLTRAIAVVTDRERVSGLSPVRPRFSLFKQRGAHAHMHTVCHQPVPIRSSAPSQLVGPRVRAHDEAHFVRPYFVRVHVYAR